MSAGDRVIAVTGATGFVGQSLLDQALKQGTAVRALTRREQKPRVGVQWVGGDLADRAALSRLVEGADAVITDCWVSMGQEHRARGHNVFLPYQVNADLMARALGGLERGALTFRPQPEEGATYAAKITKEEARIDWSRDAQALHDHIRGLSPFPGAFFEADWGQGPTRVKVLRAVREAGQGDPGTVLDDALCVACGTGALRLVELQRAGKAPARAAQFLNGARIRAGQRL